MFIQKTMEYTWYSNSYHFLLKLINIGQTSFIKGKYIWEIIRLLNEVYDKEND